MKISLFLMTQKGYEVLRHIINNNFSYLIDYVIYGVDKNIDKDFSDEIIDLCKKHEIKYSYREDNIIINSDYCIAISWRWMIKNINSQLIVIHDSLLPKYRGFAPLVNSLINKEEYIGVTAIYASDEYDRGDIIFKSATKVSYPIKIKDAISKIVDNYNEVIFKIFQSLSSDIRLPAIKQDEKEATYSLWRDESDYLIDWNNTSEYIIRFIDSVGSPYKGAYTFIKNKKILILHAEEVKDVKIENRSPGKIIFTHDIFPIVICGKGLIKLIEIYDEKGNFYLPLKKFRTRFQIVNN
ncbi:MAG: formyltransferase family protein [Bacteroidota bacterium]|nr:formyltransferase family protein [Bacteroidota bacterium]